MIRERKRSVVALEDYGPNSTTASGEMILTNPSTWRFRSPPGTNGGSRSYTAQELREIATLLDRRNALEQGKEPGPLKSYD